MRWYTLFGKLSFWFSLGCLLISTSGDDSPTTEATRIINDTKEHLVIVSYENDLKEDSFLCYGVKIRPLHFITTASCFDRFRSSGMLSIKENTVYISSVQRPNEPRVAVVGVLEHPKYAITLDSRDAKSERRYDLAILRVAEILDNITTTAIKPYWQPQYGGNFCNVTVFKDEIKPDNLVDLKVNVIPTKDCVSSNQGADDLSHIICVQLQSNPKIKKEYISGAAVTCPRYDKKTIHGLFSWGYDSDRNINNLVLTSLSRYLKWIIGHENEAFPLPGQTTLSPDLSTSRNPTTGQPTSNPAQPTADPGQTSPHSAQPTADPGQTIPHPGQTTPHPGQLTSISNTTEIWFIDTTYYPEYNDVEDSAGLFVPLRLPILLFITACILTF